MGRMLEGRYRVESTCPWIVRQSAAPDRHVPTQRDVENAMMRRRFECALLDDFPRKSSNRSSFSFHSNEEYPLIGHE